MQIECLVLNVKAVGFPDRAGPAILGVILAERFLAISGRIWGRGGTM